MSETTRYLYQKLPFCDYYR